MSTTGSVWQALPDFLQNAIQSEINRATEEELEKAKKRIDERKSEIIAGVVLHVEKNIKVETMGQELKITVISK